MSSAATVITDPVANKSRISTIYVVTCCWTTAEGYRAVARLESGASHRTRTYITDITKVV